MFESVNNIVLKGLKNSRFAGLAFDGTNFYMTSEEGETGTISRFDKNWEITGKISTHENYKHITYDYKDLCFWATIDTDCRFLFRLDRNFNILEKVRLDGIEQYGSLCTGISYDCHKNELLISMTDSILRVEKNGNVIGLLMNTRNGWISGVLSMSPYYLYNCSDKTVSVLYVYSRNGEMSEYIELADGSCIEGGVLILSESSSSGSNGKVYLLVSKSDSYSQIFELTLNKNEIQLHKCGYEAFNQHRNFHNFDNEDFEDDEILDDDDDFDNEDYNDYDENFENDNLDDNDDDFDNEDFDDYDFDDYENLDNLDNQDFNDEDFENIAKLTRQSNKLNTQNQPHPTNQNQCGYGKLLDAIALVDMGVAEILRAQAKNLRKIAESEYCSENLEALVRATEAVNQTMQKSVEIERYLSEKIRFADEMCKQNPQYNPVLEECSEIMQNLPFREKL